MVGEYPVISKAILAREISQNDVTDRGPAGHCPSSFDLVVEHELSQQVQLVASEGHLVDRHT